MDETKIKSRGEQKAKEPMQSGLNSCILVYIPINQNGTLKSTKEIFFNEIRWTMVSDNNLNGDFPM